MGWREIAVYVDTTIKVLRIFKNVLKKVIQEFIDQKIIEEEIEKSHQEYEE